MRNLAIAASILLVFSGCKSSVDAANPGEDEPSESITGRRMFPADNGSSFYVSGTHDMRWNDDELGAMKRLHGRDFEVVKMGPLVTQ